MASIFELNDVIGSCHLCNKPIESDGVLHDGAQDDCFAHKACVKRELRVSEECAKCQKVLNKNLILFGVQESDQLDQFEDREIIDLTMDEEFARQLEEELNQPVEHRGDAELARRLQEEENLQVNEAVGVEPAIEGFPVISPSDLGEEPSTQALVRENRTCNVLAAVVVVVAVGAFSYLNAS